MYGWSVARGQRPRAMGHSWFGGGGGLWGMEEPQFRMLRGGAHAAKGHLDLFLDYRGHLEAILGYLGGYVEVLGSILMPLEGNLGLFWRS